MRFDHLIRNGLSFAVLLIGSPVWGQPAPHDFQFSPPDEKLLEDANELDKQFERKGLVYADPAVEGYLRDIGESLIAGSPPPDRVTYRFRILRDPMVNAFALPNGSVYVNTGLIAALRDEAQLAAVLGHEITHVTDRHTYLLNRNMQKRAVRMEMIVAAMAAYLPGGGIFGSTILLAANVSQVFVEATVYGYSRDMERDADTGGYGRLTRANYNGIALMRALQALDERFEFEPTEPFWRTHPKLEERIETADSLAKTEKRPNPRVVRQSDYLEHMAPVIRYNATLDLDSRRVRTTISRAARLVEWHPEDAVNQSVLADAYRSLGAKTPKPDDKELSYHGKIAVRKRVLELTAEEEQKALLKDRSGPATLESNRQKAEELYRRAIALDSSFPDAHRGLGMLYQDEAKPADAVREYQAYLELAPAQAIDRLRIQRRIESLQNAAPQSGKEGSGK